MPSARPTFDCRSRRRAWQETHLDTAAAAERVGCAARALEVLSVHLSRQPTLPRKESIDGLQRLLGRLAYTSAQLACARNSGDDALREACCRLRGPLPPPPALGVPAAHERAAALVGLLTRHIERVRNERTVQAKAVLVTEWWHMLLRGTQRPGAGTGRHSCHADSAGAAKDARDGDALADGRCGGQDDHAGGGTADADLTEEVLRPLSAADPPCAMPPLLRLVWHAGTRACVSPRTPPHTHTCAGTGGPAAYGRMDGHQLHADDAPDGPAAHPRDAATGAGARPSWASPLPLPLPWPTSRPPLPCQPMLAS